MKKLVFLIILIAILIPAYIFAAGPTELEVEQATTGVLAGFGAVFLSSMFGQTPEDIVADIDMDSGNATIIFDDFDAGNYFQTFAEMEGVADGDEMPEIFFKTMSGTISVDQNGDMTCEMKLDGGPVKTLLMKTTGEALEYLKADGKDFTYLENVMGAE